MVIAVGAAGNKGHFEGGVVFDKFTVAVEHFVRSGYKRHISDGDGVERNVDSSGTAGFDGTAAVGVQDLNVADGYFPEVCGSIDGMLRQGFIVVYIIRGHLFRNDPGTVVDIAGSAKHIGGMAVKTFFQFVDGYGNTGEDGVAVRTVTGGVSLPVHQDDILAAFPGEFDQLQLVVNFADMTDIGFSVRGTEIVTDIAAVTHDIVPDKVHVGGMGVGDVYFGGFSVCQRSFRSGYHLLTQKLTCVFGAACLIVQRRTGVIVGGSQPDVGSRNPGGFGDLRPGFGHGVIDIEKIGNDQQEGIIVAVGKGDTVGVERILDTFGQTVFHGDQTVQRDRSSRRDIAAAKANRQGGGGRGSCGAAGRFRRFFLRGAAGQ